MFANAVRNLRFGAECHRHLLRKLGFTVASEWRDIRYCGRNLPVRSSRNRAVNRDTGNNAAV